MKGVRGCGDAQAQRRSLARLVPTACGAIALAGVSQACSLSEASGATSREPGPAASLVEHAQKGLSIKDLSIGSGEQIAAQGDYITLHYVARLVGDGSVVEDTRSSGWGDRFYGQPLRFRLGDLGDDAVLRVLHAAVLDMRTGGRRRIRTALSDPTFGYRELPGVTERQGGQVRYRQLQGDWLVDVEVELLAVDEQPPQRGIAKAISRLSSLLVSR